MKKILTIVLICLFATMLFACTGTTETVETDIDWKSFFATTHKTEEEVKYALNDAGEIEIVGYNDVSTRTEITIPDEIDGHPVTVIKNFSLFNTDTLQKINIGKNVREIGDWALTNNKSMKEFVVDENSEYFTAVDGVLFTKDKQTLVCYPTAKGIEFDRYGQPTGTTTYAVPEGTVNIANRAFYRCGAITEITLPSTLKNIGEMSFHRCEELGNLAFPEGLETIGKDAFTYCSKMTELVFPASMKSIATYAFSFCENVKHIKFLGGRNNVQLADKWEPTRDGQSIKELVIE